MRQLVRIAKVLSDETRIRMLKLLLEKDICVCEMEQIIPLSESQLSRTLNMMMDAGLLKKWRDGRCVVYFADRGTNDRTCRAILELVDRSFDDDEQILKDRAMLRKVKADQVREHCK